jgi:hypothetical protein
VKERKVKTGLVQEWVPVEGRRAKGEDEGK